MKFHKEAMLNLVFLEVEQAGQKGITTKEIRARYPNIPYSSITARPAQLEAESKIWYASDKRKACRVMRSYNV